MSLTRRAFLNMSVGSVAAGVLSAGAPARSPERPRIRAIAFDGLATFDPRPIFALAEQLFPGNGAELGKLWRARQFEYSWLRTLTGRYVDFWQVTDDSLTFSARMLKLDLDREKRDHLMQAYREIKAWPDAQPVLQTLKDAGMRMALLSNFTTAMLDAAVKNSGLEGLFEAHLSTDRVRAYKPDPRAYQMGIDAFGVKREEILFAAFGGWDAAGARSFGYPTFWVNRMSLPLEELGIAPDAIGADLRDLMRFLSRSGTTSAG
jgi:2-haloacid dehalogenase